MNFAAQRNVRLLLVPLACLLFLAAFYVASDGQKMVYYLQKAEFGHPVGAQLDTPMGRSGRTDSKLRDYTSANNQTSASREYPTLSTTTQYSSNDLIPKIDMKHLVMKYKKRGKSLSKKVPSQLRRKLKQPLAGNDKTETGHFSPGENYPHEQRERINRIIRTCNDRELFRNYIYRGKNSTIYYYSRKYNFSYCKVPKSGSTFWTQAFGILKYGVNISEKVFSKARVNVHASMGQFIVSFASNYRNKSLSILVSRDPFSRLYSAYIDKSYMLLKIGTNSIIRKLWPSRHNISCPIDITFQEFLDFAVLSARKQRTLNRHWAPIYNLCRPCDVNAYILVKQETFSKDIEQALQAFGVERETFDTIIAALHDHRVENSLPGIIKTVYKLVGRVRCIDGKEIAMRLWTSFKIQGYLKNTLQFPSQMFENENQYNNITYVTKVILQSINRHKMTSSEMKKQRKKALVDAYSEVKKATIEGIKELYKIDFEMFDYSTNPPSFNT